MENLQETLLLFSGSVLRGAGGCAAMAAQAMGRSGGSCGMAGLDWSLSPPWPPPGTDLLLVLRPRLRLLGVWLLQVPGVLFIPQLGAYCIMQNLTTTSSFSWDEGWSQLPEIRISSQQHGAGAKAPWSKRAKLFVNLKLFKSPEKTSPQHPQLAVAEVLGPPKDAKIPLRALTDQAGSPLSAQGGYSPSPVADCRPHPS